MRVSNLLRVVAITCAAVTVALVGAQSADAAFSYASGAGQGSNDDARSAQYCRASLSASRSAHGGGPCYFVSVVIKGIGRVVSSTPAPVPGATQESEKYPNGHIECPAQGIWTCYYYFNWPFDASTVVVLQAIEVGGHQFLGWENCPHASGNTCSLTIEDDPLPDCIIAHFHPDDTTQNECVEQTSPPPPLNVQVKRSGTGSGTVTSNPLGYISCGTKCSASMTSNTQIKLTATPASGSVFAGWTTACTSGSCTCPTTGNTCTWTVVNGVDRVVTAKFNLAAPPKLNSVLLSKPPKTTRGKNATFYWSAKNSSGQFVKSYKSQCKFGKAKSWTTCKPGKTYKRLAPGSHTFRVRVGNANGWDATPVVYTWKIKK